MILVDSCGWIEFLTDGEKSGEYAKYILESGSIVTLIITIYEVYKKVLRECGEDVAMMVVAQMSSIMVVELTAGLDASCRAQYKKRSSHGRRDCIRYGKVAWLSGGYK